MSTGAAFGAQAGNFPVIQLECEGVSVTYTDNPIAPPDHLIADEINERKINGTLAEKAEIMDSCLSAGSTYLYAVNHCFPLLFRSVEKLKEKSELKPADSEITFDPDRRPMFYITRERTGRAIDDEEAAREIYFAVKRAGYHRDRRLTVRLKAAEVKPKVTTLDNIALTGVRARFSTDMSGSGENRKHNIRLALGKINGTVLLPGGEFSFNEKVGPRTPENGFREANIILDGEYVAGYGGGVCQASTTLYNCALSAGLKITAVRNHSLSASYVPPSFDAMVNSGSSDLKFVNDGETPVFIRAYCTEGLVSVEMYGAELPYRIARESVVVRRIPAEADTEVVDTERKYTAGRPPGDKVRVSYGKDGLVSEGYLNYYDKNNRLVRRERIRSDSYAAHRGVIAVAPSQPDKEAGTFPHFVERLET